MDLAKRFFLWKKFRGLIRTVAVFSKKSGSSRLFCIIALLLCFICCLPLSLTVIYHGLDLTDRYQRSIDSPFNYDLAYLLNLSSTYNQSLKATPEILGNISTAYPQSLIARYHEAPKRCSVRPFRTTIIEVLKKHAAKGSYENHKLTIIATRPDSLTIQLPLSIPTLQNLRQSAISHIKLLSIPFKNIIIASHASKESTKFANELRKEIEIDRSQKSVTLHLATGHYDTEDFQYYLFHKASNLLVGSGPQGALAALISSAVNGVFTIPGMDEFLNFDELRHSIRVNVNKSHPDLELMGEVFPSCCKFAKLGTGDSEKTLCSNAKNFMKDPCWILSIGSNNQWNFEINAVRHTPCQIQVFDCTGNFSVPKIIESRAKFYKLCVGVKNDERKNYIPWRKIIDIGSNNSGLTKGSAPVFAKMDIEGWEFPVLKEMAEELRDSVSLPKQLEFELHVRTHIPIGYPWQKLGHRRYKIIREAVPLLIQNMTSLGYKLVHRADNPLCEHCSEILFLHRSAFPEEE